MICDGILPSNEGRGYVLRRLLRRAARHGKLLGVNDPFLYRGRATRSSTRTSASIPTCARSRAISPSVIRAEEESFARTIDGGMRIFCRDARRSIKESGETVFSGADAFKLYDTYGFPIDLTIEMVAEEGMDVDEEALPEAHAASSSVPRPRGPQGPRRPRLGRRRASARRSPRRSSSAMTDTSERGHRRSPSWRRTSLRDERRGRHRGHRCARPDAVLRRDGRPGCRHTASSQDRTASASACTDVQKNKGGKFMHYGTRREQARAQAWATP